jgi:hypothetical protein
VIRWVEVRGEVPWDNAEEIAGKGVILRVCMCWKERSYRKWVRRAVDEWREVDEFAGGWQLRSGGRGLGQVQEKREGASVGQAKIGVR